MDYKDYEFRCAMNRLLYLIHHNFKNKIGLAIYIVSEEFGFSTKELSNELSRIKQFKNKKRKVEISNNRNAR